MGNNNGIITSPINLETDVYKVLGLGAYNGCYDVGYACANLHGKINIWSLFKPVFYKSDKSLNKIVGDQHGDSGFAPEYEGANNLVYANKLETDDLFYHLEHFEGYDHYTPNPFDIEDISYIGLGQAVTGTYTYTARIPIRGIIKTIMKEGMFGILGRWTNKDNPSESGVTSYYDYSTIKDKDSVDVTIRIDWNPSDHKDFYIREYKFYLSTPALKTFTVEGLAITARFGCILSYPTVQVEWIQFDDKFNKGEQKVSAVDIYGGKTRFRMMYKTSDSMPTDDYIETLNKQGVIRAEYKVSQTSEKWELLYYGFTMENTNTFFYKSSIGLYVDLEIFHPDVLIDKYQVESFYFRITRLQNEERPYRKS